MTDDEYMLRMSNLFDMNLKAADCRNRAYELICRWKCERVQAMLKEMPKK